MGINCKDAVFGEMSYKHRWYKQEKIIIFGKEWDVIVAAKAYLGKSITKKEQESYMSFLQNEEVMVKTIGEQIREYINKNLNELAAYWTGARHVSEITDLVQIVTPKTLLFKQDGTTLMLLDCVWDEEHGIAVKLTPEVAVGRQDLFL